jgi:HEAT repeat protein
MNPRKGRLLARGSIAGGIVVLLACGLAFKDRLLEEYYLYRLQTGSREAQKIAAERLGDMGTARTVPVLLELLLQRTGEERQRFALVAFPVLSRDLIVDRSAALDGDATPSIASRLVDRSLVVPEAQVFAAAALKKLVISSPQPCVSHLAEALSAGSWYKRYLAARFLDCLGPRSKTAIPQLIQALNAPRDRVAQADRAAAARALGRIGSEAREALPALNAIVDEIPTDQNRYARDFASVAITWIEGPDEDFKR